MLPTQKLDVYEIEIYTFLGDGEAYSEIYEVGTKEDILDSVCILRKMRKWGSEVWDEKVPEFERFFRDDWPNDEYGNLYSLDRWNIYYYNANGIRFYVEVIDEN